MIMYLNECMLCSWRTNAAETFVTFLSIKAKLCVYSLDHPVPLACDPQHILTNYCVWEESWPGWPRLSCVFQLFYFCDKEYIWIMSLYNTSLNGLNIVSPLYVWRLITLWMTLARGCLSFVHVLQPIHCHPYTIQGPWEMTPFLHFYIFLAK